MAVAAGGNLPSVRGAIRSRLLNDMIRRVVSPAGGKPGGATKNWVVLIVDRPSLRILAAAVPLNELVNDGVTIIEYLELRREPLPQLPAIYLLSPAAESVAALVAEDPKQYKEFHVFFTAPLPAYRLKLIQAQSGLLRKLKACVELDIEVSAYESRAFSLDRPAASLPQLFATDGGGGGVRREARAEMCLTAERLTSVCRLLAPPSAVSWTVRYDGRSSTSRTVASLVKEDLSTAPAEAPSSASASASDAPPGTAKRATLLVLDRSMDVRSPLLHEFTYQAMAHDLLPLDYSKPGGAHYTIPAAEGSSDGEAAGGAPAKPKEALMEDETDASWVATRHLHIAQAMPHCQKALRDFVDSSAVAKVHRHGGGASADGAGDGAKLELADLSKAVRGLPEYTTKLAQHSLHVNALDALMERYRKAHLDAVAGVEQDLATGTDAESQRVRSERALATLGSLLERPDIADGDKGRVLALAAAVGSRAPLMDGAAPSPLAQSAAFTRGVAPLTAAVEDTLGRSFASVLRGLDTLLQAAKSGAADWKRAADDAAAAAGDGDASTSAQVRKLRELRAGVVARREAKRLEKERANRHTLSEDLPFELSRYAPPLRGVGVDLATGQLDATLFPVCGGVDALIAKARGGGAADAVSPVSVSPSLRRGRSRSADCGAVAEVDPDHEYVLFFVGGVCHSEVRAAYEVAAHTGARLTVGGSALLTPRNYLDALAAVDDPVTRIKLMQPPPALTIAQSKAARARAAEVGAARGGASAASTPRGGVSAAPSPRGAAPPVAASRAAPSPRSGGVATAATPAATLAAATSASPEVVTSVKKKKLFGRRK